MSGAVCYERVRESLEQLKLDAALAELDSVLEQGQKNDLLPVEVLDELLQRERALRFERRVKTNFKLAGLPVLRVGQKGPRGVGSKGATC